MFIFPQQERNWNLERIKYLKLKIKLKRHHVFITVRDFAVILVTMKIIVLSWGLCHMVW
jgi:hypothetical protein